MADVTITDGNFDEQVLKSDKPVLVDFWAVWCGPCQIQGPIVKDIAQEMEGKAIVGEFNVDENPQIAQKYNIMSIPTIMIFKGGTVVRQFIGVQSKEILLTELNRLIN